MANKRQVILERLLKIIIVDVASLPTVTKTLKFTTAAAAALALAAAATTKTTIVKFKLSFIIVFYFRLYGCIFACWFHIIMHIQTYL